MARLLPPLLVAALLLACTPSAQPPPAAAASPSPSASSTPPEITLRAPAEDILTDIDVGLAGAASRDHLSLTQAASEQENQPLALTNYRAWGWVDAADRTWITTGVRVDEELILLTRPEGADLAFQGLTAGLPERTACPDSLGLEQCAENGELLVGRLGRYSFRIAGANFDLNRLAGLQAARIRRP